MGRWTQYDEDEYRLPEGMKRVGYDSDTQKYYYRDQDGSLWEGAEGAGYGELKKVSDAPAVVEEVDTADIEAGGGRADGYAPLATEIDQPATHARSSAAYRNLLPFFLLICVALLLVVRLVVRTPPPAVPCPADTDPYRVEVGDTCWGICESRGCKLDALRQVNPGMKCESLRVGQVVCVPEKEERLRVGRGVY
ncbi:carbohydrate-binding module family 50 protein [Neolentinus lepideus HHB14362 ss-1]|uniref:Carbohydrate-binding module family 50 protein n=1 Tax=Neolentinus lepideus HHB14362 ss-1 TaxID=1314782 RepID=A0A165QN89_9AGAM|nr:carbohydrate-binding module family 50 protein [Neolentinus lepideus HHB14362 ss-1]